MSLLIHDIILRYSFQAQVFYWQANEITNIIKTYGHELDKSCLAMLPHVSPIGWDNVILYGEYVLDRSLIK